MRQEYLVVAVMKQIKLNGLGQDPFKAFVPLLILKESTVKTRSNSLTVLTVCRPEICSLHV